MSIPWVSGSVVTSSPGDRDLVRFRHSSDRSLKENLVVERAVQLHVLAGHANIGEAEAPIET